MRRRVWALAIVAAIVALAFATLVVVSQPRQTIEIPEHLTLQVSDIPAEGGESNG